MSYVKVDRERAKSLSRDYNIVEFLIFVLLFRVGIEAIHNGSNGKGARVLSPVSVLVP